MKNGDQRSLKGVALIGLAMMLLLGGIAIISGPFAYDQAGAKPTLAVVAMLMIATAISVWAIRTGLCVVDRQRQLFWLILSMGIGFRAVMLLTPPILEVDYYRYLWDGKVAQAGVSPYRYSPQTVIDANVPRPPGEIPDQDLETLAELANSSTNYQILSRVHYPELTTLYPPTSQLVFWIVARVVPIDSSVWLHVFVMRGMFVLFDLGTILLLAMMLGKIDRHLAWLIAYAWNPLVIKEIANSGHLDSLAVFLMVAAVLLMLKVRGKQSYSYLLASGITLGLAVGAKLFPVILVPAFVARLRAYGWKLPACFCIAFLVTCLAVLYPMSGSYLAKAYFDSGESHAANTHLQTSERPSASDPDGLTEFLSTWRSNDAIFSSVYYNLKPDGSTPRNYWYIITTNELRLQVAQLQNIGFLGENSAFTLTRMITLALFSIVYVLMLPRFQPDNNQRFLSGILFVLFAFLMLQPTINPWYWVWIVPFTCFDSRCSWAGISGVLIIYYTKFYFKESSLEFEYWQRSYQGVEIFDHFIVWIELFLIVLFVTLAGRLGVDRLKTDPTL